MLSRVASFLCSDGLSLCPFYYGICVQFWVTVAGLGAGGSVWGSVWDRVAAGLQQRVCGWRRGGIRPWVGDGGSCSATVRITKVLDLLAELVTFHF